MAFKVQNLSLCSYSANEAAPVIYSYSSDIDRLATITSEFYFGSVASDFNVNDILYISDSTDLQTGKGFYFVVRRDIELKIVTLAPLIGQSGAISDWIDVKANEIDQMNLEANKGYRVINEGLPASSLRLVLPAVENLSVGNTIMFNNYSGYKTIIMQKAGQQIFFPNNLSTTEGATDLTVSVDHPDGTGYLTSANKNDSFTLVVLYNDTVNPNSPNPPPDQSATYGTEFNINNIMGKISYF